MGQVDAGERSVRDLSWGGVRARALLHDITSDAAARVGFRIGAIEVVRPQGLLEFVAVTGEPGGSEQLLGTGSRLEDMLAAIADGETTGAWTFVAEEAYSPGVEERLSDASWVSNIPRTDDPGDWQPLDMLVAAVRDERGGLRALFYLDEPVGLRRLSPEALAELDETLSLTLDMVLAVIEREEFAHHVRSIRAARRLVRSGPARHDVNHLLREARTTLLGALSVDELEIHVFIDEDTDSADGLGLRMSTDIRRALDPGGGPGVGRPTRADRRARPHLGRREARRGARGLVRRSPAQGGLRGARRRAGGRRGRGARHDHVRPPDGLPALDRR